jgi:hypothetical protein
MQKKYLRSKFPMMMMIYKLQVMEPDQDQATYRNKEDKMTVREKIIDQYNFIQKSNYIAESILYGIKNLFLIKKVYEEFKEIEQNYKYYVTNMNTWIETKNPIHIELYIVHCFFYDLVSQASRKVKYINQRWYGKNFLLTSILLCSDMNIHDIRYYFNQASLSLPVGSHHSHLDHAFDDIVETLKL